MERISTKSRNAATPIPITIAPMIRVLLRLKVVSAEVRISCATSICIDSSASPLPVSFS
jgi:hypothetical protein